MRQHDYPGGRNAESSRHRGEAGEDVRYQRSGRGEQDESWMHDKQRQASRAGYSDNAYEPRRGQGAQGGRGQSQGYSNYPSGERSMYGAHGPDIEARGYQEDQHYDSGWRARGFDERWQSAGEDDRGDAPWASTSSYRGSGRFPAQNDARQSHQAYGGESAGSGGRQGLYDYDEYDPRGQAERSGRRAMGEGYGRSSGYAGRSGFGESAYGAGFEANDDYSRGRGYDDYSRSDQSRTREAANPSSYREQGMRSYRGQGPRRYTRSDERITEDLNERLTEDELIDASDIEVRCSEGKIVLEGEVSARWMKHRAEDIADACSGVKDVENRIRVRGGGQAGMSYETGGRQPGSERQQAEQRSGASGAGRSGTATGTTTTGTTGATSTGTTGTAGATGSTGTASQNAGGNQPH